MKLITKVFNFIILTCNKYNIDDSHGLSHSMNVLNFAHDIYKNELLNYPCIKDHQKVIYMSSALHDMCDKKYMNERDCINDIRNYFKDDISKKELTAIEDIITTMSYSKVKINGFPDLKEYNIPYHIVREADLLAAYDFDRTILYKIYNSEEDILNSFDDAINLFHNRVFKHNDHNLFYTNYSKNKSKELYYNSIDRIKNWDEIVNESF